MQFVSSQPTRRSIHSKCCFMEVIDKAGCSPRKGDEVSVFQQGPLGAAERRRSPRRSV